MASSSRQTDLALIDHGQGLPFLLVHGFPLNGAMWNAQIEPLAKYCRVLVPDLRGFGHNDPTPPDQITTMEQMADDLAALLDRLNVDQPIVLAGLSMGGYIALAFHKKYPQRLRALVLTDTRAAADTPTAVQSRQAVAQKILEEGPSVLIDMLPKLFAPGTLNEKPQIVEAAREMILQANPHTTRAALLGMAQRDDSTGHLPEIACPTLLVVGAEDRLTPPAEMRTMAQAIPDARLVEIPDAGHMSPMEQPTAFNTALIDLLTELRG